MATPIFGIWPPGAIVANAMVIGEPVAGATAKAVLFVGATGKLDQDPGFFDFDKVTHTLDLHGPFRHSDDGKVFEFVPSASHGAAPSFFGRLSGALFGGAWDPVFIWGFNVDGAGLPVNPAFGTVALSFEGFFNTQNTQEVHVVFGKADGSAQTRVASAAGDQTTGAVGWAHVIDAYDITSRVGAVPIFSANASQSRFGVDVHMQQKPDTNSAQLVFEAAGGVSHLIQALSAAIVGQSSFNAATWHYATVGGAASELFRTGVTMGGNGDKAVNIANLTLVPEAAQTAPLLDASGAGAVPLMKLAKTAIVPVGALVRFKVQDETGAVFYLTGQAA